MIDNTKESIKLLTDTIQELYTIELIFTDLKNNEVKINYEDESVVPDEYDLWFCPTIDSVWQTMSMHRLNSVKRN